jgi:hypothetical protein
MHFSNPFTTRTLWMATAGIAGLLFLGPRCQAQEVAPDHFTDKGVDGVWAVGPTQKQVATLKPTKPSTKHVSGRPGETRSVNHLRRRSRKRASAGGV